MKDQNFQKLSQNFIKHLENSGRSSLTIIAYRNDLAQLIACLTGLGRKTAGEVISQDIELFKKELLSKNYTPKSIARKLNAVKGFFRWLLSQKLVSQDPAAPVPHPRYELSPPRILSPLEYRALRDAAREDPRIYAIVELLLQTGMRISEVASLAIPDLAEQTINILGREVPLNQPAKKAVESYIAVRPKADSRHLFITKTGHPFLVRNIRAAIERCFAEAGIERATVNDLRNTFIIHQLENGIDLVTVSKLVGHKRLATTERYLSLVQVKNSTRNRGLSEL